MESNVAIAAQETYCESTGAPECVDATCDHANTFWEAAMAFKFALYVDSEKAADQSPRFSDNIYPTRSQADAAGSAAVQTLRKWLSAPTFIDVNVSYKVVFVEQK